MQPKKFLNLIAGFILLVIVVALILFLVRDKLPQYRDDKNPDAVVSNYLTAILRENYDQAYGYLGEWKQKPSYASFEQRVSGLTGYQFCLEVIDYGGKRPDLGNETTVYIETYRCGPEWQVDWETYDHKYDAEPYIGPNEARLKRIDGTWKIEQMPLPWWDQAWLPDKTNKE